jgi:hypothetical protein
MRTLLSIALVAALAACTGERAPRAGDAAALPAPTRADDAVPAADRAPEPAPASSPKAEAGDAQASFAGYGDVRFGTAEADMEAAWGGELNEVGKDFNPVCYFMTPLWVKTPAELNFMISEGRFARVGTESARFAAPGGGKVGMTEAALQALYDNALQASPHKYTDGKYLSINASGVAPTRLVFETDEKGIVTEWRVGVTPEVDYVEGCS